MFVREWLSLVLVFGLTPQAPTGKSNINVLDRAVVLKDLRGTSVDAVAALLAEGETPGEIVSIYGNCSQPSERVFSSRSGVTLREALDYVSTVDRARRWNYRDGVIVIGSDAAPGTILGTILGELAIKADDSLSLSTQKLLQSKEVRDRVKKAGLLELNTPLGLSELRKLDEAHVHRPRSVESIHLGGKTLEQALNILASARGKAAWHYEQFGCGQKISFRVSWLIQ